MLGDEFEAPVAACMAPEQPRTYLDGAARCALWRLLDGALDYDRETRGDGYENAFSLTLWGNGIVFDEQVAVAKEWAAARGLDISIGHEQRNNPRSPFLPWSAHVVDGYRTVLTLHSSPLAARPEGQS